MRWRRLAYTVLSFLLAVGLLPVGALPAAAQGVILPPTRCFELPVPLPAPEPIPLPPVQVAPPQIVRPPVPVPPTPPILPCWLTLTSHSVAVQIQDQLATTRVDQVFRNDTGRDLEGTYLFPLPEDATVTSFSMFVDGQQITGEVLGRDEARRLYESIVRVNRDPALLEFAGRGAFQANVFPVPAGGQRTLRLEYSQVLAQDSGLIRYVYPTAAEKLYARPAGSPLASQETSFSVAITSTQPLRSIYSPTHDVSVTRAGDTSATVTWSSKTDKTAQPAVRKQFELVYAVSPDPVGLSVASTRPTNEDGYFLLLAAPSLQLANSAALPKDVTLVFDTSGSMAGAKIEQAKAALRHVLNSLNPADRFGVVAFSSTVNPLNGGLRPASDRAQGLAFVDGLTATGGTNINDALVAGLTLTAGSADRPHIVVFVTDGLPTVGPQTPEQLIANAKKAAGESSRTRVFTFGVGYDVNTTLLDKLAADFGGVSAYVRPEENLEEAVSSFYSKVSSPVLTDLALDFGGANGADVYDVQPVRLPDLYAGTQLVVTGRYRRPGTFDVTLRGTAAGQPQAFTLRGATFATAPVKAQEALPRLWAGRKIGFLLSEIRLRGAAKELVDEVVALATRYGVATPYTSIFVPEPSIGIRPGVPAATPAPLNTAEGRSQAAEALSQGVAAAPSSGAGAVQNSVGTNLLKDSQAVQAAAGPGVKTLADKTFQLVDGVWNDVSAGTPPPPEERIRVTFGSDEYFALLDAHPDAGAYLSAGPRVLFELGGTWYEILE